MCYGYCVNDWWCFFLLCYFSLLIILDTKHKTMVCLDQIVLYRLQRIKPISIMCVSSFKIGTATPIVGRYLMDETKLTRVGISQVKYKQHLTVGHCDIMVAEWIKKSFKSQHGMLSKTVLEMTRLVQNNRKNLTGVCHFKSMKPGFGRLGSVMNLSISWNMIKVMNSYPIYTHITRPQPLHGARVNVILIQSNVWSLHCDTTSPDLLH